MSMLIAAAVLLQTAANTAAPPATAGQALPDDIVVTATKRNQVARDVRALTGDSIGSQVPRWNTAICLNVAGLAAAEAKIVGDGIAAAARDVGVPLFRDCAPNVQILVARDPAAVADELLRRRPLMFRDVARYGMPRAKDRAELLQAAPVRWTTGTTLEQRGDMASRLTVPARENKQNMIVIVDLPRCAGINWQQLSAYLAMVVLANPQRGDGAPAGSIMALFDGRATTDRVAGLTRLDRSVLKALYATQEQVSAASQQFAMTDYVLRDRRKPAE